MDGCCTLAVDLLKKTVVEKLPNDVEGLESTIERLQGMIDTVFRYVEDVVVKPSKFIPVYTLVFCTIHHQPANEH